MEIRSLCESYFSGFGEISRCCKNDKATNALAVLKILSYLTIVMPLGFGLAYGMTSLCGRVSEKKNLSLLDSRTDAAGKQVIAPEKNEEPSKNDKPVIAAEKELPANVILEIENSAKKIKNNEWLDQKIIAYLILYLANENPKLFPSKLTAHIFDFDDRIVKNPNLIYYYRSLWSAILEDFHYSKSSGHRLHPNNGKECDHSPGFSCENKSLFAYPINISENHWTLVLVDREKCSVEYYDSMGDISNKAIDDSLEKITQELSTLEGKQYKFERKIKKRIQYDSISCGLWATYFVEERIKNPEVDFNSLTNTNSVIAEFRELAYQRYINMRKQLALDPNNKESC